MRNLIGKVVFSVGDTEYRWADVILAGLLWGDWEGIVDRARQGIGAASQEEAGAGSPVTASELETAADEFRYARDLVAADETEAWLARWGLTVEGWMEWIRRDLLRQRLESDGEEEIGDASGDQLAEAVHAEAVCSGALENLARRLAARAAIVAKLQEEAGEAGEPANGEDPEVPPLDAEALSSAIPGGDPTAARERLRHLAGMDVAFRVFKAGLLTPEAIAARVRAHQTDWTRVACRVLPLPTEDVAREALLSIQDDGCSLEDVASDAGAEVSDETFFIDELDGNLSDRLLASQKGSFLGPLSFGDGFALIHVLDKVLPRPEDDAIEERAARSLVGSIVTREVDNRVSWRWKL